MKLKVAKKILETELRSQLNISDFIVDKDKQHSEILQVKLGENVSELAQRMVRNMALRG